MIFDGFADLDDLKAQYEITDEELKDYEILFACYETGCYDGSSIVILKKEDKFYIVEADHCSCYGLEGQFDPIETSIELLKAEAENKKRWPNEFIKFIEFVDMCLEKSDD